MSIAKKDESVWENIEKHGAPCKIVMQCDYKKTYTGAGYEYTPLNSVVDDSTSLRIEELRRGKENILWGRLYDGRGWIDLKDVQLSEN